MGLMILFWIFILPEAQVPTSLFSPPSSLLVHFRNWKIVHWAGFKVPWQEERGDRQPQVSESRGSLCLDPIWESGAVTLETISLRITAACKPLHHSHVAILQIWSVLIVLCNRNCRNEYIYLGGDSNYSENPEIDMNHHAPPPLSSLRFIQFPEADWCVEKL